MPREMLALDSVEDRLISLEATVSSLSALVAQLRRAKPLSDDTAASVTTTKIVNNTVTTTAPKLTFLATPLTATSDPYTNNSAIGWTTFDASSAVPGSATSVLLECQGCRDTSTTGIKYVFGRKDSSSASLRLFGADSDGSSVDVDGSTAQFFVPCSNSLFNYTKEAGIRHFEIRVIGYIS
jgi:hypothetical protein